MTTNPAQPCFALTPGHLQTFSHQMVGLADAHRASRSMDLIPAPSASSRWSAVAAMTAKDVVHGLMEQICDRGATAVEHLWPVLPSHALIESRLCQMVPDRVHVLRRMLRDGPLPGQGAEMVAPLSLPPLPSRQAQSVSTPLNMCILNAAFPHESHLGAAAARGSSQPQHCASRLVRSNLTAHPSDQEEEQAQPQSAAPTALRAVQTPTISNVAPARISPSQQADIGAFKVPKHVPWDSSSDSAAQSASDQSSPSQSASHSTRSSISADSQTLSEINAKIAVLTKWGQPLPASPQLPAPSQPKSPSRQNSRSHSWQRMKRHPVLQSEQLGVNVSQPDSAHNRQALPQPTADPEPKLTSRAIMKASAQPGSQADVKLQPLQSPLAQSSNTSQSTRGAAKSGPLPTQAPHPVSPRSMRRPQKALGPSQRPAQRVQQPPGSSKAIPLLTQSSPQLPNAATEPHSQKSLGLGLSEAEQKPQAQSPLQMWPHVRKYVVPQPLKAPPPPASPPLSKRDPGMAQPPQAPQTPGQTASQGHAHSTDRHAGLAATPSTSSPVSKSSPLLKSTSAPASALSQMLTALAAASRLPADSAAQIQTHIPPQMHGHVQSQGALQEEAHEAMSHKTQTMAGAAAVTHTAEWIKPEGCHVTHEVRAESQLWQTPQLPSQWSGQGGVHPLVLASPTPGCL